MIKCKIVSRVSIPAIKEDVIVALIKAEIAKDNPEVVVTNITLERKLNPQRVEAIVEARLASDTNVSPEVVKAITEAPTPIVADVEEPEDKPVAEVKRKKVFDM